MAPTLQTTSLCQNKHSVREYYSSFKVTPLGPASQAECQSDGCFRTGTATQLMSWVGAWGADNHAWLPPQAPKHAEEHIGDRFHYWGMFKQPFFLIWYLSPAKSRAFLPTCNGAFLPCRENGKCSFSVIRHRATLMMSIHQNPGTCCVPPPAAPTGTVSALSPQSTMASYRRVSFSNALIIIIDTPPPLTLHCICSLSDSAHRGLSPCPAVTAVMRNPVYTVRSHRVHTSNCPSVASQICHQHTHTRLRSFHTRTPPEPASKMCLIVGPLFLTGPCGD